MYRVYMYVTVLLLLYCFMKCNYRWKLKSYIHGKVSTPLRMGVHCLPWTLRTLSTDTLNSFFFLSSARILTTWSAYGDRTPMFSSSGGPQHFGHVLYSSLTLSTTSYTWKQNYPIVHAVSAVDSWNCCPKRWSTTVNYTFSHSMKPFTQTLEGRCWAVRPSSLEQTVSTV